MPVSAVRMSCANTASTASLADAAALRRGFRALRRAGFEADFLILDRAIAIPGTPRPEWHGGGRNKTSVPAMFTADYGLNHRSL
jgi:hypothetical protein